MPRARRIGIVSVPAEVLLQTLDFKGGKIIGVKGDERWPLEPGRILIAIEHKDMPIVKDGECVPYVKPAYITHFKRGAKNPSKITRKKEKLQSW